MDNSIKKPQDDQVTPAASPSSGVEQEPVPSAPDTGLKEAVHEHSEIRKPKEVTEHVKEIPQRPDIPAEVEKAGLQHAGPATPVASATGKTVKLPLTDDEILKGLHAHIWESLRWMATWCVRRLKKAHIRIKEARGHLVRNTN